MNRKLNPITGTLFVLFSVFVGTSCNNDDNELPIQLQYAIYNDTSNPVTNNQVSLDYPSEEKTELVIFGGNGKYFISNSDDTKLSVSSNYGNGMLELTPLAPGDVVVTINDSHNNSYTLKVQIKNRLIIKINAKEKEGNIFDLMEFNMFSYSEKNFTLLDLTESYDSIVWSCTNTNQRYHVLEHSQSNSNFTSKWSNCFFLPAEYETCLLGYKNDRLICSDTILVNITNNNDFLGYNWKNVVRSSEYSKGYQDVFFNGYKFATHTDVTDGTPSVSFFLFYNSANDESDFAYKSKQILFDYICSLHSTPIYSQDDNNSVSDIYNELFRNKKEGYVPEYIWITAKSNIVLLEEFDGVEGYPKYEIYAEPIR